jgi:hypothetical protein
MYAAQLQLGRMNAALKHFGSKAEVPNGQKQILHARSGMFGDASATGGFIVDSV